MFEHAFSSAGLRDPAQANYRYSPTMNGFVKIRPVAKKDNFYGSFVVSPERQPWNLTLPRFHQAHESFGGRGLLPNTGTIEVERPHPDQGQADFVEQPRVDTKLPYKKRFGKALDSQSVDMPPEDKT